MIRSLFQLVRDTEPLHSHHEQRPFHLNTAASVVIVFCGLGASISFMGVVALYFWCFKRQPRGPGQQADLEVGEFVRVVDRDLTGEQPENRALREKISKRIVEQLPVITVFDGSPAAHEDGKLEEGARRSAECCSVCLTEFQQEGSSEGLTVRRLPECGHCFHTECIRLWLCSYLSCPLCRRNLNFVTVPSEELPVSQLAVHQDQATRVGSTVDHVVLDADSNTVALEMSNNSFRSATSELGGSGRSMGTSHEAQNKINLGS